MRNIIAGFLTLLFASLALAGFEGIDNTTKSLGVFNKLECSTGATCTKVKDKFKLSVSSVTGDLYGDGGDQFYGFLQNRVAATATTITAAQCGSTFYNSGAVEMELPEASAVLGCRLTFVVANASNFHVDPDAADQILTLTNAAGDRALNATLGGTLTLEAISASQWAVVASNGTWTDAD